MPAHRPATKAARRTRRSAGADVGVVAAPGEAGGDRETALFVLGLILLATTVVFSASFSNGFLDWDDPANVTLNAYIRAFTWENLKIYFTRPLLGMYTPLVYLSYALDYRLGGLNPFIYHLTNLLLHLVNVCLVFVIVYEVTRNRLACAIAAALFAVHPVNVAAVTPVSVRSSLLFSSCYLAAYLAYLRHVEKGARTFLVLSLGLFVMAALAKAAAVVFPLLMLLTDYVYDRPLSRRSLLQKAPFILVALAFGILTFVFREDTAALASDPQFPLGERLLLACHTLVLYGRNLIVPVNLSAYYPYPQRIDGYLPLAVYVAPAVVIGIVWLATRFKTHRKLIVFGGLFALMPLVPVLKIVPIGAEFAADRYLYLPSIGVFIVGAVVCARLDAKYGKRVTVVAAGVVLLLGVVAHARNGAWRDTLTFYSEILRAHPDAAVAYCNRGAARLREERDVAGALEDFESAIRFDANYGDAYYNRATARLTLRNDDDALRDADRAIQINPHRSEYYQVRADARIALRDYRGAIADSARALALNAGANAYMAYLSRGIARFYLDDAAGAIEDFTAAIRLNPGVPAAYQNRANARVMVGDERGAIADYDQAIAADPAFATAYYYRGLLGQKRADKAGSCADFRKAAQLGLETAAAILARNCQ